MIVVSGEMEFEPGNDEALRDAMVIMMAESAKEDGCIHYRFYRDVGKPEVYHVYEEWESGKHLGAHANSAHMAEYREKLGKIGVKRRDVKMIKVDAADWKHL